MMHRDPRYLDHVRRFPCTYCQKKGTGEDDENPPVAHHHGRRLGRGGTAVKVSDFRTVPLCARHHVEFHQGLKVGSWTKEETDLQFFRAMVMCLESWILRNGPRILEQGNG